MEHVPLEKHPMTFWYGNRIKMKNAQKTVILNFDSESARVLAAF